ncbi:MAG: PAS domain S-box protein [Candidatus Cloacimonetes bacterium]|nr:PAS domain S-box protein [Candidatus Cloacimonadota bacterium]
MKKKTKDPNKLERLKRRISELEKAEEQYRIIAENTNDNIAITTFDLKAKYLYVSPSVKLTLGYEPEELLGRSFFDFIHPDDKKVLLPLLKKYLDMKIKKFFGKEESTISEVIEFRFKNKIGNWRYMQSTVNILGKNLLAITRDITERMQTQKLLLKEKEYYRSFLSSLNDWAWEMDMNGIHTYSNSAVETILGYKAEEIVGYHVTDFWDENSITPKSLNLLNDALTAGKGWKNVIGKFKHKKGKIIITESTAIPTYNSENKLTGYRGIDRDITKRMKADEELKISKKRLKILNSILRHDITNDLAVIKSAINLYIDEPTNEMLNEINKRVNKCLKTIERQRKQENFLESHSTLEKYKIENVISETKRNYPNIDITISGKGTVYADKEIYSVFENLITNSIKHGNATKLNIIITTKDNICEIKVCDNGIGIHDEIKIKVFDKGFVHGKNGHTGLGLYIVKQTIEDYAGHISVEDNEPKGTIFVIILKRVIKKYGKI